MLPLFARRTKELGALLPELYLHGLAEGDFELAMRGLLGEGAPLSKSSIRRLRAGSTGEFEEWSQRRLEGREVVYVWADGIYVKAGLERDKAALLVVLGAMRDGTKAIRAMEGGSGHYMGMMAQPVTGAGGVAFLPGRSSFAVPVAHTIAHELGHNMNLQHAPCGTTGDASFPYPDGSIGVWGYNFREGGSLVRPARPDLMSYCFFDQWISNYSFTNALRYRLFDEGPPAGPIVASSKSLLLWGGVGADSVPYLEPAFVVDAPPVLPDSAGEYLVTGRTTGGDELFSLSFTMPEVADGDGSSSFAFVLPAQPGWEGNLASITLAGPAGSFALDGDLTMAILRNPRTREVRGILRDLPQADAAAALAPQAGPDSLDVLFSRGIPDAASWSR